MSEPQPGRVSGVVGDWVVNIAMPNGSEYPSVVAPQWYAPQVGDEVLVGFYGGGNPYIAQVLTTADRWRRTPIPASSSISSAATAPPGAVQAGAIWYTPSVDNPAVTLIPGAVAYVPPPAPPGVLTYNATNSGTWDNYYNGWRGDQWVYQAGDGNAAGIFLYEYGFPGLSAVTPTRITFTLTRYEGVNGSFGPVAVHLWSHGYTGFPGVRPVMGTETIPAAVGKGETLTFDIDLAYANQLKSGAALGLGVTSGDYMRLYGAFQPPSGQINIYH